MCEPFPYDLVLAVTAQKAQCFTIQRVFPAQPTSCRMLPFLCQNLVLLVLLT